MWQSEGRTVPSARHSGGDTQQRPCRASSTGHEGCCAQLGRARCHAEPWPGVIPAPCLGGQSSGKIYDSEKSWLGWFFSRY